ncbi:MAG: PhoPQ-activated pathogenicity protein [Bryobacteraceae bacterium]|nr:MAG: PhoPQ-activated pathogenicity protein [Bryobacteraceae bacterium]
MKRLFIIAAAVALSAFAQTKTETPLDRYVHAPDPAFQWKLVNTIPGNGVTTFVLEMVSQNWLAPDEVDRTEWRHHLAVVRPDRVESDVALLLIGGGRNGSAPPKEADPIAAIIARRTRTVTAELRQVPNQPLSFFGESRQRTEDAIIAYTWKRYLETGDERWPARLPMTKAAVRAMDAVQQFIASEAGGGAKIARWVVTGGSKRGWTTWTTAAVDRRVVAIIPAVIDLLNLEQSFIHHWRVYGFWAPAVSDYVEHGVMDWMGTPQFASLMKIVEPFEYRDRLVMPKFILNSAGDQFFVPDSSQFYFDQLKGEKYLRYVPNTDHGVTRRSDAAESLAAFYESIVRGWKRPEFSWKITPDGKIEAVCKDRPSAVKLWTAANPGARDFRLETIGRAWTSVDVQPRADGVYVAEIPKPARGFAAGFLEFAFPTPGGSSWKFTTAVKVVPDVYPFPPPKPGRPAAAQPAGR